MKFHGEVEKDFYWKLIRPFGKAFEHEERCIFADEAEVEKEPKSEKCETQNRLKRNNEI